MALLSAELELVEAPAQALVQAPARGQHLGAHAGKQLPADKRVS